VKNQIDNMTKAKPYPKPEENSDNKISEPISSLYESIPSQKDLACAITGDELLSRLRPRIKALFDK